MERDKALARLNGIPEAITLLNPEEKKAVRWALDRIAELEAEVKKLRESDGGRFDW